MENYQMNRPYSRPYHATCGMSKAQMNMQGGAQSSGCGCTSAAEKASCACRMSGAPSKNAEMYTHVDQMEPAMAYVPCQKFETTYDLCYALKVGTIFPQLCKPFCGKRGVSR